MSNVTAALTAVAGVLTAIGAAGSGLAELMKAIRRGKSKQDKET